MRVCLVRSSESRKEGARRTKREEKRDKEISHLLMTATLHQKTVLHMSVGFKCFTFNNNYRSFFIPGSLEADIATAFDTRSMECCLRSGRNQDSEI